MNWEAIGAVGEAVGAIAVILTLVYVAVQVKNAREEMRQSILQSRDTALRELNFAPLKNPLLGMALAEDRFSRDDTGPFFAQLQDATGWPKEQIMAFHGYLVSWWFYRVQTIRNIDQLSDLQREDFNKSITASYSGGFEKLWWEQWKAGRSPSDPTVEYCEKVLREGQPSQ